MTSSLGALSQHGVHAPLGHLLGVASGADSGDHYHAGRPQTFHGVPTGGLGERGHPHLGGDEMLDPSVDVAGVGPEVDAERCVGGLPDLVDGGDHLVEGHRDGGDDPQAAGPGGGCGEPGAGHPTHAGLDDRVPDAHQVAERGVEAPVGGTGGRGGH